MNLQRVLDTLRDFDVYSNQVGDERVCVRCGVIMDRTLAFEEQEHLEDCALVVLVADVTDFTGELEELREKVAEQEKMIGALKASPRVREEGLVEIWKDFRAKLVHFFHEVPLIGYLLIFWLVYSCASKVVTGALGE